MQSFTTQLRRGFAGSAALSALLLAAAPAPAAEADSGPIVSELLVTGQKQAETTSGAKLDLPAAQTPQSISVITRDELDLRGVGSLNQAVRFTAGVAPETRGNTAGRYDQLNLRGFSPDRYLDGLRLIDSSNGYNQSQIDIALIDRIEVVKGPASALYGLSSPGGLIAMSSKLPRFETLGEAALTVGDYGYWNGAFDLGGVLDKDGRFAARVAGVVSRSDTQIRLTEAERYAITPSITWKIDDKTSWTLAYAYQDDPKTGAYGAVPLRGSVLPNPNGRIARDFFDSEPAFDRFSRTQQAVSSFFTRELGAGWSFRQNARFMRVESEYRSVYIQGLAPDLRTLNRGAAASVEGVDGFTLDNQVSGKFQTGAAAHAAVFGLDYQHTGQTEAAGFGDAPPLDAFKPVYGAPVAFPATTFSVRMNLNQTGVYAQDQVSLGGWRVLLSGRFDWVDISQYDRLAQSTSALSQDKFTGRAGLLYVFDNGLAPYASYATSFQPQTTVDAKGQLLPPTEGEQVEIGLKYQPRIWNALVTLSLYDLRQTNVATQDPKGAPGISIAAGEIRSRGVELEGRATPVRGLQLNGAYTYLDNLVTKDNSGLQGARPYGVPQQTASAFGVYTFQEGAAAGLGLGGGVRYLGHGFNGVVGDGKVKIPEATLFDLIANYDLGRLDGRWRGLTLSANVNNLFDKRYITSCYATMWCWYGSGRTAQATLRYRW